MTIIIPDWFIITFLISWILGLVYMGAGITYIAMNLYCDEIEGREKIVNIAKAEGK